MIDKKKENSMILCITVNDTQACYALICNCQKNRKKRAVNAHVHLDPKEKPILEENDIPAQCNISIDNRDYIPENIHKTTARISLFGFTSKNHSDDTKTLF